METVDGIWVPIVMFAGLAVVLSLLVWFNYRSRREIQITLRAALEKGHQLSPELIERLTTPPANRDLRRGMISVGLAVGFALFAVLLGEEDAVRPLLGTAMFPLALGAAFLLLHRFGTRGRD